MERPVLGDILSDIKEEIIRRDLPGRCDANIPLYVENIDLRENASWVKVRKMNMRLKNSRLYVLLLPFVNALRYLFNNSRYKNGLRVRDLISLSDEDFLRACYFKVLGRKPDEEGMDHYLVALRTGKNDKIGVINSFVRSKEAKRRKARVEGLFLYNVRRAFVRIPVFGYLIRLVFSIFLLPKRLKEISASIDRISANIDAINKEQLFLKNKIKDVEDHLSDPKWK